MKTSYLIKSGHNYYVESTPTGKVKSFLSGTREAATRFASVKAVLTFWTKATQQYNKDAQTRGGTMSYLGDSFTIVRIEETPGTETRRELGETEQAKPGETVKYAIYGLGCRLWWTGRDDWDFDSWKNLDEVTLYTRQQDAIEPLTKAKDIGPVAVRRIAVKPATPVLIETELK